ncbi:MAG: tRNA glutamyl-Q(34) synthetase GluQRS [Rhodospirillaceae bacterium]|nr:tRNA glutamyl-Q(34) synthetase GluQRS [Rhodospirillaceae bacterium]|tara:strand:- start:161 stop:1012 length:852 start_codon:yes stop_codon:yes gene_type:complete
MPSDVVTRFAPSPTGFLHLGHAYSALFSENLAKMSDGIFLVRFEDIDRDRCSPDFERAIIDDLSWLNLKWHGQIRRQSDHMVDYTNAVNKLKRLKLLYPCTLSRKELSEALSAPHPDTLLPQNHNTLVDTDKHISNQETQRRLRSGAPYALRLRMKSAIKMTGRMTWHDTEAGIQTAEPEIFGDIVIARKDIPTSYHLSVTVDDAIQGITTVTRGDDLFGATHVQRLLQELLELPTPNYCHHKIITDDTGKRLAKRNKANTLKSLRESGINREDILKSLDLNF